MGTDKTFIIKQSKIVCAWKTVSRTVEYIQHTSKSYSSGLKSIYEKNKIKKIQHDFCHTDALLLYGLL